MGAAMAKVQTMDKIMIAATIVSMDATIGVDTKALEQLWSS